ncbi:MAG: hypothetical protein UR90_C0021G0001 [Parcubacteria group bacterium GW2011_GWC1_35_8]|uniref:Uncharacterized protein n=2 Tax=Candidatus Nomuraibacteriota TaxID=1752729 RepID=A0A1F6YW87_9BACT|nr:MAG: hypothetical protein UR90_C0021G0001 [Parcubacteria group bacterium GW2011_GWC1_35_8]KKP87390.1 MAG: hypothetical protein UR91_C0050G0002 [Candidatus Nomurabacteria bacterium GW2011_GWC2_35_8]OGJ10616.1 MAG: hypothetical protein A2456_01305 [Candidatus Nomurabacteria bacterium RIFOXYC2_FULL_36_19]OGJ13747.1 MAG: hypothetical protein A2554_03540 [Candidatus Nomurabacteria bacterium RIFOXYD2_FULL_35_12]
MPREDSPAELNTLEARKNILKLRINGIVKTLSMLQGNFNNYSSVYDERSMLKTEEVFKKLEEALKKAFLDFPTDNAGNFRSGSFVQPR